MNFGIKVSQYLAPRYWPGWLLLGLMYAGAQLPLRLLYAAGTALGELAYRLAPRRRRIAEINIDLCFPELSEQERKKLVRDCFHSTGKTVLEIAYAFWGNQKKLLKITKIEGLEHLQNANRDNRPVLMVGGHMCCVEIVGRVLAYHVPFQVIYKPAKNRLIDEVILKQRLSCHTDVVPHKQSRRMLKNLKKGLITWYAPDQSFGGEDIVYAPFFGVPAATLTATSRLCRFSNAVVVPFFPYRLPGGKGYRMVLQPPLENFPSDSVEDDAARINKLIEDAVRVAPEQYLWLHRRFHRRPKGEAEFY